MRRRLRALLGLVLFFALVGFAFLGITVLTGWPGLAVAIVALLVIATLPIGAR